MKFSLPLCVVQFDVNILEGVHIAYSVIQPIDFIPACSVSMYETQITELRL